MIRGTAHRHIHHAETARGEIAYQPVGLQRVNGGHVDNQRLAGERLADAVIAKQHLAHQIAVRQHGNHEFRALGGCLWRGARRRALGGQRLHGGGVYIAHLQPVPVAQQVCRHRRAHLSQSDKSNRRHNMLLSA
ncbi:hypothetical protein BN129_3207 [Cronobacter sakazakii 701]|nr:hypothetical protein BN129_3207 [Cronobacter sakazakii 701]